MEEILPDESKMSCFICDATGDPFFSAKLSHTSSSKTSFSEVIRSFVGKFHEFEILDDDLVCQTCITLLEELDELNSKSLQVERILMAQIYRKYHVDTDDRPIYDIKEKQLQIFDLNPFSKQAAYQCQMEKCQFSTKFEDSLIPHWKFHEALSNQTVKAENNKPQMMLYQCSVCSTAFSVVNLLAFHMELFHSDKIVRPSLEIDALDAAESDTVYKHEPHPMIGDVLDIDDTPELNEANAETGIDADPEVDAETDTAPEYDDVDDYQDSDETRPEIQVDQDEYLRCPICEFCAVQADAMVSHIEGKHGHINFQKERRKCQFCRAIFSELNDIIGHLLSHPEVVYNCTICGQVDPDPNVIIAHFKEEHLKTDHQNETETDDNKKTDNEAEPTPEESAEPDARHEVDDLTDPTPNIVPTIERQCEACPALLASEDLYIKHKHTEHLTCTQCPMQFRSIKPLESHIRRRHTKHPCQYCDKVLGSKSSLDAHLTIHGYNATFKCTVCDKGFKAKSLYETHMAIHTKEYNYTCHICGQKFIHQRSHRIHVQWHDNPRPHKCPMCEKTYKHRSHLAVHRRSHFGERPNACAHCDRRFTSASKLKVHMVVHTGIFSHPCPVCGKGFMKRYKLAEHLAKIHEDNTMLLNKPKCEYKVAIRPDAIVNTRPTSVAT